MRDSGNYEVHLGDFEQIIDPRHTFYGRIGKVVEFNERGDMVRLEFRNGNDGHCFGHEIWQCQSYPRLPESDYDFVFSRLYDKNEED